MRLPALALLLLAAIAVAPAARAQFDDGAPPDYVTVKTYLDRDAYHPGETARVVVEMRIDPKVHVNTNSPTEDYQFATSLTWEDAAGLKSSPVTWPKGEMKAFEFTEGKKIAVYEGTQRVTLSLEIPAGTAPGAKTLKGVLKAQGCTHTTCYAPQTDEFSLLVRVVAASEPTAAVNEDKFASAAPPPAGSAPAPAPADASGAEPAEGAETGSVQQAAGEPPTASEEELVEGIEPETDALSEPAPAGDALAEAKPVPPASPEDPAAQCPVEKVEDLKGNRSLALVFLLTFIGGIGLAFTPCVLPLVPITIGFFARQLEGGRRPIVPALLYVLGLALVYSAMGTVAALTGGLFGSLLQKPAVLIAIAALLFALSLSMFGLWDMKLPSALSNRLGGGRAGNAGAMAMGGAMGIVAAPCVGPFVFSLLTYVAELGSRMSKPSAALLGGALFMALSLGLGLPFFLVAIGAGSLRPGEWMVTVKKVFGFVILGVVLWFLRPIITAAGFQWGLALLLLVAGVYFISHSRAASHGPRARKVVLAVGLASVVAMMAWTFGLVHDLTTAEDTFADGFQAYSEEALARAKADGRPVIIDFRADWCILCIELEEKTFPHELVQSRIGDFVALRCDLTDSTPENDALTKRWRAGSLPQVAFLGSDGEEIDPLRLRGFEKPQDFAVRMDCATAIDVARR